MSLEPVAEAVSATDIAAALKRLEAIDSRVESWGLLLVAGHPLRIVWGNTAATALFGSDDPDLLWTEVFSRQGRGGLSETLARLPTDGAPRLERVRIVAGFRVRSVTVSLFRWGLASGASVFAVAAPGATQPGSGDPLASALVAATAASVAVPSGPAQAPGQRLDDPLLDAPAAAETGEAPPDQAGAVSEASPARPASPDEDLSDLRARRSVRFVWRTDAAHRIVQLVGASGVPPLFGFSSGLIGQGLADTVAERGAHPEGQLRAALDACRTWSGVHVAWPVTERGATAPASLGGVPVTAADGSFGGFRGFGVLDLAETVPGRAVRAMDPPERGGPETTESEPSRDQADNLVSGSTVEPAATTLGAAAEPVDPDAAGVAASLDEEPSERQAAEPVGVDEQPSGAPVGDKPAGPTIAFSSKVVALRPHHWVAAFGDEMRAVAGRTDPPALPVADPSAPQASPVAPEAVEPARDDAAESANPLDLTLVEQAAFQEIGRILDVDREGQESDAEVSDDGAAGEVAALDMAASSTVDALEADRSGPPLPDAAALIDLLPEAVLVVAGQQAVHANRAFLDLTGHATVETLGQDGLRGLLDGADPSSFATGEPGGPMTLVTASGERVSVEGRIRRAGLTGRDIALLTVRPSDRADGTILTSSDAARLGADLAAARETLDGLPTAWAMTDRSGQVLDINRAARHLFGLTRESAAGQALTALLAAESHAGALALLATAATEVAGAPALDVTVRKPEGRPARLRMTAAALGAGKVAVSFQDRTGTDALQRDLTTAQQALQEEKTLRSDFLAKVSHEVRTPLNAILGFAEVILDERFGPLQNPRYREYLRDIHQSGTHVMSLVNDLLDLSRMEAGRVSMSFAAVDINRIVAECVAETQADAHRQRVIVRQSLLPRLPAALVDERAARQIVMNILSNAVKFNEPGGQVIVSTAVGEGGSVAIRVRDTGIGMSDDEVGLAVEPFRQIATGTAGSGSGLGLPLTKALVEANHAAMTIKSRKQEGTLVEIVFQAAPATQLRVPA